MGLLIRYTQLSATRLVTALGAWRMSVVAIAIVAVALPRLSTDMRAQAPIRLEYQVKAAFLLNFAKFVEWPAKAFALPTDPIVICVVGRDPFGGSLDRIVSGEKILTRSVSARYLPVEGNFSPCHVLFIGRTEQDRYQQVLARVRDASTLTVGEVPGFSDNGGMIEFVIGDEKLQFFINSATTDMAGLRVSSRLLRVAKEVKDSRG